MTIPATALTPGTIDVSGVGAAAEAQARVQLDAALGSEWMDRAEEFTADRSAVSRAEDPAYWRWLAHVRPAAGCVRPVRLAGRVHQVDTATGEVVSSRETSGMPDGVIYKACGNRRACACPSCAEVYRADAYQLVAAGLRGGKGVPDSVTTHPCVFLTLTAPSFGIVHTRVVDSHHCLKRDRCTCPANVCRPRRKPGLCPHGVELRCFTRHGPADRAVGSPLCLDCYDHNHHVVWNTSASELWRRTTIYLNRIVRRHARAHRGLVRVSFGKVAEMQHRGAVHFHAVIRLDGINPLDRDTVTPPPAWATVLLLAHVVRQAVENTAFTTDPHPARLGGWPIGWGGQLDIRVVRDRGDGSISDGQVAGYLAKYATKSTEQAGHVSRRLTPNTVDIYADTTSHTGRLIAACWRLGDPDHTRNTVKASLTPHQRTGKAVTGWLRLQRWAHQLGWGGHFFTKTRRYSTTFRALRDARTTHQRRRHATTERINLDVAAVLEFGDVHLAALAADLARAHDPDRYAVVTELTYAGSGWRTTGDQLLANTAAAITTERRHAAREASTYAA